MTYTERLIGLDCVAVKTTYNLRCWIVRAIFGVGFLIGVGIFVTYCFKLGKEPMRVARGAPESA